MAVIQNQAIIQKLIDELELYPALDKIPTELADKILPTFQVNTQEIIVKPIAANIVRSLRLDGAGPGTIYTTPATGKFYLTNVTLAAEDDPAADNSSSITIIVDGVTVAIAKLRYQSGGATGVTEVITQAFFNPILIDPATDIVVVHGAISNTDATIVGYTEE